MSVQILIGDCLEQMAALPDGSVHCCITSPPYYGLRCYGVDGQIGLEPTPEEHIAKLVEVFREVRRVLRKDGVLWLNYGDAYANDGKWGGSTGGKHAKALHGNGSIGRERTTTGLKPKDLLMMPARVALALQQDGWWLRSMLPWVKRSAMPESVTDRPATAIEYVFLLAKSQRYYFDMEAVRQGVTGNAHARRSDGERPYAQDGGAGFDNRQGTWKESYVPNNRNFRNSDLFYASLEPPHGLIVGDEPLALDVNPAAFSDWTPTVRRVSVAHDDPADGKQCTPSQDCPRHGDLIALATRELRDEGADGRLPDIDDIGSRLVAMLSNGSESIDRNRGGLTAQQNSDCPDPSCSPSATDHSKENRKTGHVLATSRPCTPSAENPGHIADRSALPASIGQGRNIAGSNIVAGGSGGSLGNQKSGGTAGTRLEPESCEASSSPECTCKWYIEKEEKTSHFATFPPKLVEPLIKAGTSEKGVCAECGAPWVREVRDTGETADFNGSRFDKGKTATPRPGTQQGERTIKRAAGWSPSCACNAETAPALVLDCFGGAGTVGLVADRLGRDAVLIELNPEYAGIARRRIDRDAAIRGSGPEETMRGDDLPLFEL